MIIYDCVNNYFIYIKFLMVFTEFIANNNVVDL